MLPVVGQSRPLARVAGGNVVAAVLKHTKKDESVAKTIMDE